ncbi:MAG: LysR substrate-binding domain-containing protein [Sporolactobacillus sp.]
MRSMDLAYYQKLFNLKSYTKVAAFFKVSQPTVTAAVQRLEEELDAQLLIRDQSHHALIFTESGIQFQRHAETVLRTLNTAKKEIQAIQSEKVRFGFPPIIGGYYFPPFSDYLVQIGKLSALRIEEDGSQSLLDKLLKGYLDLALIASLQPIADEDSHLTVLPLACHKFRVIVGRQHALAAEQAINFQALRKECFVQFNEHFIHPQAFKQFCAHSHIRPKVLYHLNDLQMIKGMVARNIAVSLLAEPAIHAGDPIVALPLSDQDQPMFHVSFVYRSTHVLTDLQQQMVSWFSDAGR